MFRSEQETERLLWQYWYNMQANPNQRAFDIGMCSVCMYVCVHVCVCACMHVCCLHALESVFVCRYSCLLLILPLLDRKNCENAEIIEDLGHNAFSVQWSPAKGPAKVCTKDCTTIFTV